MSSFIGSYTYAVDAKGRINIPARMKKNISPNANEMFIITRGYEECLFLYPHDEWIKVEESIRNLISADPQHRFIARTLLEWATESTLDKQSRIVIPKELLQFAHITTDVKIIGVLDRIEVWNPKLFDTYKQKQQQSYEDVAAQVFKK
ncbi:MAG: division/cell wall cluster transcriptional repressor MraZ [Bacteroidetes bacterium]|nr:division/cell wall cluster transcriptional repressor MraZ [Bacteroidota bacterium]